MVNAVLASQSLNRPDKRHQATPPQTTNMSPRLSPPSVINRNAGIAGTVAGLFVTGLIILGSRNLRYFDWVLLPYVMASIFCAAAVAYRYTVWLQRPPTKRYWQQGWRLFWRDGPIRNGIQLSGLLFDNFATQRFIGRRSHTRWLLHLCLSWGSMLAFAITFPLVFGWIHFQTPATDLATYQMFVFGMPVFQFHLESWTAFLSFNALNISAILVLIGVGLAVHRRLTEPGAIALQQFGNDILPLLLLFVVSITGLGLSVSARWLHGHGFTFIAVAHAASVIAMLLYLPFGKFFHIFQRPLQLGGAFYKRAAQSGPQAACRVCLEPFASQMQIDDLKQVLAELHFQYAFRIPGHEQPLHYQDVCPACRRKLLARNQGPRPHDPFTASADQLRHVA